MNALSPGEVCFPYNERGSSPVTLWENCNIPALAVMTDTRFFEELDRRIKETLARSPAADLEKNLRVLLQSAFSRLDLVTREEFDVQRAVLARTRAKLEELEAKLAELEGKSKVETRKSE